MTHTLVPLAGPDFVSERFGIRPLHPVAGRPLLEAVLADRPWLQGPGHQLTFVLREEGPATARMRAWLEQRFPLAGSVTLGSLTRGAPLSALAGCALGTDFAAPVVVDLADIAFRFDFDAGAYFRAHPAADAVVPFFTADDPKFSYLRLEGHRVLEAREKQVISAHASAGAYVFRDAAAFLRAVAWGLAHPERCSVGGSLFVCPCVNGLMGAGREVHALPVQDAQPLSLLFHAP